jgi:hypothetical protein
LKLETMLTPGKVDNDVVSKYPELDSLTLPIQLEIFKQLKHTMPNRCMKQKVLIGVWNMQCAYCFPKYWFY